jgi:uncharacterized protein (TIRG00374 family)
VVVTLALLAVVARQIDWSAMQDRVENGHPAWALAAVALIVAALAIGALRWRLFLRAAELDLSVRQIGRVYAVSTFSSTFLPTSVGGDVARALLVARRGSALARAGLTVVLDRAAAFAGLLAVAVAALVVDPDAVPSVQVHSLVIVLASCVVAGTVAVLLVVRPPAWVARRLPKRAAGPLREVRKICHASIAAPTVAVGVAVSSVVFQALVVLQVCAIARAFSIDLEFSSAAVAFTLVTLAVLMPISIGGFGIREGSYIVLLGASGVSSTDATLISLASVAVLFVASLPGAVLLALHGMRPALESA